MPNNQDNQPVFIWISIIAAILFWLLDSVLDTYVFEPEPFLVELFPAHEPSELWMRFIVVSLLIAFGVYTNAVTKRKALFDESLRAEIQERKIAEQQLLDNEQCLHEFYSLASGANNDIHDQIDRLLHLGCKRFDMDIGILSNIHGNDYRVVQAVSPDNAIEVDTVFPLSDTFCETTINTKAPISYLRMIETEMQTHPAYLRFKLEAYIGTRVMVNNKPYGTLNFSSPNPRETEFTQAEIDFLQLMGEWIGSRIQRRRSERKHQQAISVFNNTNDGIIITDPDRNIIAVNNAFTTITGYTEEEAVGKNPSLLKSGHHDDEFYNKLWESVSSTGQWQGEIWNRRRDGELIPLWQNISEVKNKNGDIENYTSVFSDISKIKQYEERLHHAAHHDALTGLANRVLFSIHLEHSLQKTKRNKNYFALLFLDLDGFKSVNDNLGHAAGDQLLQETATRIKNCIRDEDTAARFGGDEFTVILEELNEITDAELVAAKIINAVSEPITINNESISVSTSIGISVYPEDAKDASGLMHAADTAMFRAKNHGKNNYRLYCRMAGD